MATGVQGLALVINAVQGKIGLVLRPFPVVLVSAEGRHRYGRGRYQANVFVGVVEADIVLGTVPHAGQGGLHFVFVRILFLHDGVNAAGTGGFAIGLQRGVEGFHLVRYVQHPPKNVEHFSRQGDFLGAVKGPESLFQVVVLRGGEIGHVGIDAVVVGNEKAVFGNEAAAAVEAQRHHGVGQAARLLVVYFPHPQLEAASLHVLFQRPVQALDEPHALIGPCPRKEAQAQQETQQYFPHEGFIRRSYGRSAGGRQCGNSPWSRCRCIRPP